MIIYVDRASALENNFLRACAWESLVGSPCSFVSSGIKFHQKCTCFRWVTWTIICPKSLSSPGQCLGHPHVDHNEGSIAQGSESKRCLLSFSKFENECTESMDRTPSLKNTLQMELNHSINCWGIAQETQSLLLNAPYQIFGLLQSKYINEWLPMSRSYTICMGVTSPVFIGPFSYKFIVISQLSRMPINVIMPLIAVNNWKGKIFTSPFNQVFLVKCILYKTNYIWWDLILTITNLLH